MTLIQHLRSLCHGEQFGALQDQKGVTLFEVLLSFMIFSVVLIAMLGLFTLASRQNTDTTRYNTALTLAQSKIEEIKKQNFASINDVSPTDFSSEEDYAAFDGYSYKVMVENNPPLTKTVTVTVSYSDKGVVKQLSLTTDIARR